MKIKLKEEEQWGIGKIYWFWNGKSLRTNPKKSCGGAYREKFVVIFLRLHSGWRDAWCVIHRENASWRWVMFHSAPKLCWRMNQFWATKCKKSTSYLCGVKFMPLKVQLPGLGAEGLHRFQGRSMDAAQLSHRKCLFPDEVSAIYLSKVTIKSRGNSQGKIGRLNFFFLSFNPF